MEASGGSLDDCDAEKQQGIYCFHSLDWWVLKMAKVEHHFLKNLPLPLFTKEGYISSLWQREVRRDFIMSVFIVITLMFFAKAHWQNKPLYPCIKDSG